MCCSLEIINEVAGQFDEVFSSVVLLEPGLWRKPRKALWQFVNAESPADCVSELILLLWARSQAGH